MLLFVVLHSVCVCEAVVLARIVRCVSSAVQLLVWLLLSATHTSTLSLSLSLSLSSAPQPLPPSHSLNTLQRIAPAPPAPRYTHTHRQTHTPDVGAVLPSDVLPRLQGRAAPHSAPVQVHLHQGRRLSHFLAGALTQYHGGTGDNQGV